MNRAEIQCAFEAALRCVMGPRDPSASAVVGQLRYGPGRLSRKTVAHGSTFDAQVFGPGEACAVLCGGRVHFDLVFKQSDGQEFRVPALNGVVYPYPHEAVWFDSNDIILEQGAALLHGAAELVKAAVACAQEWTPDEIAPGAAAGDTTVDITGEAGFEYTLEALSVRLAASGAAANRRGSLALYQENGTTALPAIRSAVEQTASDEHRWRFYAGSIGSDVLTLTTLDMEQTGFPLRTVRFTAGQTALKLASVSYENGQAGDSITVVASVLRRAIL